MKKINTKYKIITAFILGVILTSGVVYAATVLGASNVSYNNSSSKLSSTTVQGAIDEIYNNATGGNITYHNANIVGAYMYDAEKCTTGDEVTCRKTNCPNDTSKSTCPAGTIIKYKVNDSTTKTFYVLHDDVLELTLQQNENTVASTKWYSSDDNTKGPTVAIEALEEATSSWSNVNTMNYTMGTTIFGKNNVYTGCSYGNQNNWNCTTNTYTWNEKNAKVRMITAQEANAIGCIRIENSCPSWMVTGDEYWLMSAFSPDLISALIMYPPDGNLDGGNTARVSGARAVVVISK